MNDTANVSIGIDLASAYSCICTFRNGSNELIKTHMGERTIPSYVSFSDTGTLFGASAQNQQILNLTNTIFGAKRLIGNEFDDEIVETDIKRWPFKVICDADVTYESIDKSPLIKELNVSGIIIQQIVEYVHVKRRLMFEVECKKEKKRFYPKEICAMMLTHMKQIAETYLGKTVKNAVLAMPTYFNYDDQRKAIKDAGKMAGLEVMRVIGEPIAAALAYGLNKMNDETYVLAFDLGASTLDITLLLVDEGVFEVIATAGNKCLGGNDFDDILVDFFTKEFERKHKVKKSEFQKSKRSIYRLHKQCERIKRTLSTAACANIAIDSLYDGIDFSSSITRAKFEDLCMHYFRQCIEIIDKVLKDAKINKKDVEEVVLSGGSTRIPRIQAMIKKYFDGKKLCNNIEPEEVVANGAAIQAEISSPWYANSQPHACTTFYDPIPLSLGIETTGSIMTVLIARNRCMPCTMFGHFTTVKDNQSVVCIQVFEGERLLTKDNNQLGQFELTGISPAPRGVPVIKVTFELDENGILTVTATDWSASIPTSSKKIRIGNDKGRLSVNEINKIVQDAEKYKAEDEEMKKMIQAKIESNNISNEHDIAAYYPLREEYKAKENENDTDCNHVIHDNHGVHTGPKIDEID